MRQQSPSVIRLEAFPIVLRLLADIALVFSHVLPQKFRSGISTRFLDAKFRIARK